jgi:hypothetical protein
MEKAGLAEISENRYRVVLEESWQHERPEIRRPDRRWYEQIPCKGGAFIGLYAEDPTIILQLFTPRPKNARFIFAHIKELPGVKADFGFDGEAVIYFPKELLHQVAEMAEARIKRRLSPEARANLAERGRVALEKYRKTNYQGENLPQISPVQVR